MDTVAERILVIQVSSVFFSVISLLSCGVNVALIVVLQKRNGYLAILMAIAVLQAIYDASFVLYFGVENNALNIAGGFFQLSTGLAVTFWTNILAVVVFNMVVFSKSFDILKRFPHLCVVVLSPSIAVGLAAALTPKDKPSHLIVSLAYYWIRIVSISINFFLYSIVWYRCRQAVNKSGGKTDSEKAMITFANRLIYYPVVQTICRIGAAFYQPFYSYNRAFPAGGDNSTNQFVAACVVSILTPSGGLLDLIVFLIFQPNAFKAAKSWFCKCEKYSPGEAISPTASSQFGESLIEDPVSEMDEDDLAQVIERECSTTSSIVPRLSEL